MTDPVPPRELLIQGITHAGRAFRPSDWAERLCGVMSSFRPEGNISPHAHLGYSPYVRPTQVEDIKAVIVDVRLRALEPLAFEFVIGFARDNDLVTIELPPPADPLER